LGGILVEVLRDVALTLAPVDEHAARLLVARTRGSEILAGTRGQTAYDIDALARAIVAISRLTSEDDFKVSSAEINPLRVFEQGVLALDAFVTTSKGELCSPER
jgi:acetyltransferase